MIHSIRCFIARQLRRLARFIQPKEVTVTQALPIEARNDSAAQAAVKAPTVKESVLAIYAERVYLTRSELAKVTGLRVSTLCSALNALVKEGKLRVAYLVEDEESKRMVSMYSTPLEFPV